ncbi:efflux RND transporter permease subunit [Rhodobaculum claviforme]|uniref:Acriflavine resistance protein B n=1 Tax=Rhodobaculum claviforme TaxID=1549854 RepID=A0A934TIF9_9RHOB|nr:efflux RND transporter permease subunit [Rhodobaculum claviforme]MBK5926407.1 acriflavine resistance protein B [Rhodobaculum claviforme]
MTGIVDWAARHARMVVAFIVLTLGAGIVAYVGLPKEGEPDIEIPALFISVPFPGVSAQDSENLLVRPMEAELADLDDLKTMTATASENFAGVVLEFEFGWDKQTALAEVRDRMTRAEAQFPSGFESYTINEINFSQFPIVIVSLSGDVPERTLQRLAREMQDRVEAIDSVLEAELAGAREEMLEVIIDPLRLEAYNVTAGELIQVVTQNNQLVAAGEVETDSGTFAVKVPAAFTTAEDVYRLPVKVNGDSVVRLGDLADIRLTFEDRTVTARFNGEPTVALQVVMRRGFNQIATVAAVRETVEAVRADWPEPLREAVQVATSLDRSVEVEAMVRQLEGSVLTAISLVMIVVLAALGTRSALLVGFAIPASFFLTFLLFAVMDVAVSNIVMFGLILSVGILVDGAVVVVEYADKRIREGTGPMTAYTAAAKRMFWPIVASTATTLCAFLPMLFWPGVAGEFMGMLPVTLIFVLCAALVVALVYLPVVGGVTGRMSRSFTAASDGLRARLPWWACAALVPVALYAMFLGAMQTINPAYLLGGLAPSGGLAVLPGAVMFTLAAVASSVVLGAARIDRRAGPVRAGHRRTATGRAARVLVGNPLAPVVTLAAVAAFVVAVFGYYGENNRGVEFFVETEPERGIVYVMARGNLSLMEKDALVREAEQAVMATEGVAAVFAFAGRGGLNSNTAGAQAPLDTVGQVQFEFARWEDRTGIPGLSGREIRAAMQTALDQIPGIRTQILEQAGGPGAAKPVHLRLKGQDLGVLAQAVEGVVAHLQDTPGIIDIEDTRPLPGIDWQIDVDVERAGRFGADVATVGGMVQLVTRGILLDTMRVDTSTEEIDIRVRLPQSDRVLATLDSLRVQTAQGLVPLSNFITRTPVPSLAQIDRVDQTRFFDIKADVADGLVNDAGRPINATERIEHLTQWLEAETPLPAGVEWAWTGDQQDQQESGEFLMVAFAGALALMFLILLAQFNSFYNATLVLLAVVLSTTGVLIGMLAMDQTFSIIMTGTGIVALAGIVVNNNIVLIDTYQEYARHMPRIEAIVRTVEARIRPVLMTTATTMAGLTPMMLGVSLDFIGGGYSIDSPTALWWKQLATAVVFGLGIATLLTLVVTPSLLALRVWLSVGAYRSAAGLAALSVGPSSQLARDRALARATARSRPPEILWEDTGSATDPATDPGPVPPLPLRAAE